MKYKYTLEKVHRKSEQVDNIHNPIQVQVKVKGSRKPKSNKFKTASHRSSFPTDGSAKNTLHEATTKHLI